MTARTELQTYDPNLIDTLTEELIAACRSRDMISGVDIFNSEERHTALSLLAATKAHDEIEYEQRRNDLQDFFGSDVTRAAIDAAVAKVLSRSLAGSAEQEVADELVAIGLTRSTVWHNPERIGFATFDDQGHLEHHPIETGREYRDYLSDLYGQEHERELRDGQIVPCYPTRADLNEAIYQLHGHATRRGEEQKAELRMTWWRDALWLDLGRDDWKGVRVTADGWRIVDRIEAPLIRGQGMQALPVPEPGGNIFALREFTNVRSDEDFALFCGTTAALYNRFGHYTTTIFTGPAGSAKTTGTLVMRRLCDPHKVMTQSLRSAEEGIRDLMHACGNNHVIAFENISKIDGHLSDAICRINTGSGHFERKYREQGILFMTYAHCPVFINGIPPTLAEREDLIDRSVTLAFQVLGERALSDDQFWQRFAAAEPQLLGAILDGVVGALRVRAQFSGNNDAAARELLGDYRPRFVDHVVFAESACRAMGFPAGAFATAYRDNQEYLLRYFVEHNPVCVGIVKLTRGRDEWRGYPEGLYKGILPYTLNLEERLKAGGSWLSRESLPRAIGALRKIEGIVVETKLSFRSGDNNSGIRITHLRGNHGNHFSDGVQATAEGKAQPDEEKHQPEPSPSSAVTELVTEMVTMPTTLKRRRL